MNTKLCITYIPDERGNILIKDVSLFPRRYFSSPDDKQAFFIDLDTLYYTSFFSGCYRKIFRIGTTYRSVAFQARKHFIAKLLRKWSLSSKEVEVPIKIIEKPKVKAKPKLKHSPHGIQVDVVRVPQSNDYLVTRVQALHKRELPLIYTDGGSKYTLPRVWQERDTLIADNCHALLCVGETYSYGKLKRALLYIELAGRHLTVANQHMKSIGPGRIKSQLWRNSNWITFKDGRLLKDTTLQKRPEEPKKNEFWLGSLIC